MSHDSKKPVYVVECGWYYEDRQVEIATTDEAQAQAKKECLIATDRFDFVYLSVWIDGVRQ